MVKLPETDEAPPIAAGDCQCGCGMRAPISPQNHARLGYVKGEPRRFIRGHARRRSFGITQGEFWERVAVAREDECWPWQGARTQAGYGQVYVGANSTKYAHRVAAAATFGAVPDGMVVLHSCDNPPCCNPAHLRIGTQADNVADMYAKGRGRNGSA